MGSAVLVAAAVSGCTADERTASPAPTSSSAGASAGPAAAPTLESIADYWTAHPESVPQELSTSPVVLNEHGTGPDSFALPDTGPYSSLVLTVNCSAPSGNYALAFRDAAGAEIPLTRGGDCAGEMTLYETPVEQGNLPVTVDVQVPADTEYYVVAYGKPIH
jgi:hypothetical protein